MADMRVDKTERMNPRELSTGVGRLIVLANEELSQLVPRSARSNHGIAQDVPNEDGQCHPQRYRVDASARDPIVHSAGEQKERDRDEDDRPHLP